MIRKVGKNKIGLLLSLSLPTSIAFLLFFVKPTTSTLSEGNIVVNETISFSAAKGLNLTNKNYSIYIRGETLPIKKLKKKLKKYPNFARSKHFKLFFSAQISRIQAPHGDEKIACFYQGRFVFGKFGYAFLHWKHTNKYFFVAKQIPWFCQERAGKKKTFFQNGMRNRQSSFFLLLWNYVEGTVTWHLFFSYKHKTLFCSCTLGEKKKVRKKKSRLLHNYVIPIFFLRQSMHRRFKPLLAKANVTRTKYRHDKKQ